MNKIHTPEWTAEVSKAAGEQVLRITGIEWDTADCFRITAAANALNVYEVRNLRTNEADLAELETIHSVLTELRNR